MDAELFVQIMLGVITIVTAILGKAIIPYAKEIRVYKWIQFGVQAAEQLFQESGQGERKKQYVLEFLHKKGIKLNESELEVLIEAFVNDLHIEQSK